MFSLRNALLAGAALGVAAGCSTDSTAPQIGTIVARITDAPSDQFESVLVWVTKVELAGGASGPVTIADTAAQYDLLSLQNGVTALLASASVPTGSYEQLRLVVDSAHVWLKAPLTFADGSTDASLRVPSGMQTGIKVNFGTPVQVEPGTTDITVDFDVSRSFVFHGPAAAPESISFKPVIHATATELTGSIGGTVSPASSSATVWAIVGTDTVATAFADAVSGAYTLRYLPAGMHDVAVHAAGYQDATVAGVTVGTSQDVTGVDFTLTPAP
jgi:hypothetical protein